MASTTHHPFGKPAPASLWRLTGPEIPADGAVALRTQTLIVGAGLAGLAVARELTRAGQEVVVMEAGRLGGRTTSRTTGKVSLLQGTTASEIRSHAGEDALAAYVDANAAGAAWMRAELADVPGAWHQRDAFTYATTDEGLHALTDEAAAMALVHRHVDACGRAAATGLSFEVSGALRLADQAQIHPVIAAWASIERIRGAGGTLVDGCRVTGVHTRAHGVEVSTDRGPMIADRLVLATGTPILDRALLFAALVPERQAVVAFRLPDGAEPPPGMYLSADADRRSVRAATDRDGAPAVVVGGGGTVTGRSADIGKRRDDILAWATEHYPGATPITWWAAQDYRMTTHLPFAGPVRGGNDRIFALTGFAKWGMTNAPAAALAVTGEITGTPRPWNEALRAQRPGIRDARETLTANVETGAALVAGWVAPSSGTTSARAEVIRDGLRPVAQSRVDGTLCRLSAVCPHLGGIVRWNDAESSWDCPLHGSRFTQDGRRIEGPTTHDLRPVDAA